MEGKTDKRTKGFYALSSIEKIEMERINKEIHELQVMVGYLETELSDKQRKLDYALEIREMFKQSEKENKKGKGK